MSALATQPPAADPQHVAQAPLRPLHPRVVRAWRVRGLVWPPAVALLLLLGTGIVVETMPAWLLPAVIAAAAATLAVVLVAAPLRYRAWGWAVREADVFLRRGVLIRTTSIVPYARIQHVDTRRGPVDRWLRLATLVIYTAGVRGAVLEVPGLDAEEAEALRDHLAALSGLDDGV